MLNIQLRPRETSFFVRDHTASASRLQNQPWQAYRTFHICAFDIPKLEPVERPENDLLSDRGTQ